MISPDVILEIIFPVNVNDLLNEIHNLYLLHDLNLVQLDVDRLGDNDIIVPSVSSISASASTIARRKVATRCPDETTLDRKGGFSHSEGGRVFDRTCGAVSKGHDVI